MTNVTLRDNIYTNLYSFSDGYLALWDELNNLDTYQLLQFHLHAPSEHTFDGKNYDVEIHFVHKHTSLNKLVALGIFFDVSAGGDKENDFIASLKVGQANNTLLSAIPAMNLFKQLNMNNLYHYEGSLTTPPCNETVEFVLINDPQPISSN